MIYKVGKEQGIPGSLTDDRSLNREESRQFLGLGNRRAIEEAGPSVEKHSGPNCRETPVLLCPSPPPPSGEGGLPDGPAQRELEVRDPAAHRTLAAQRMRGASRCRRREAARASCSEAAPQPRSGSESGPHRCRQVAPGRGCSFRDPRSSG